MKKCLIFLCMISLSQFAVGCAAEPKLGDSSQSKPDAVQSSSFFESCAGCVACTQTVVEKMPAYKVGKNLMNVRENESPEERKFRLLKAIAGRPLVTGCICAALNPLSDRDLSFRLGVGCGLSAMTWGMIDDHEEKLAFYKSSFRDKKNK